MPKNGDPTSVTTDSASAVTARASAPTKPAYAPTKDQLLRRLRRIEGQIGGVSRMVAEERYCIDVLAQISAVQGALDRVAMGLVADHARQCVIGVEEPLRSERTEELLEALDRFVGRR